jgi:hypothetical protein
MREGMIRLPLIAVCLAAMGCGVGRSQIRLAAPGPPTTSAPVGSAGNATIRSVTDGRVFEEKAQDPSTPTLDGGASKASAEVRARAVGRKGSIQLPLGDVVLEGQTAAGAIRENVSWALEKAGYRLIEGPPGDGSTRTVDVQVKQFWAWVETGFSAITVRVRIATSASIGERPVETTVDWDRVVQTGNDDSWTEALDGALQKYRREFAAQLVSSP